MIAQEQFRSIPCVIALNPVGKLIAFNRLSNNKPYIDIRNGVMSIWDKGLLKVVDKEYNYNAWHPLETNQELFDYFKDFIYNERLEQAIFNI